jgi:hypothetical protein
MGYLDLSDQELLRQCEVETFRGTGPGGQKRNKTSSAVRIRHRPTGLAGQSDDSRSQHANRRAALHRLRERIALEIRRPVRLEGYRPPASLLRMLGPRGSRPAPGHPDRPRAVAALLDLLAAVGGSVGEAAALLEVSTGRLSRVLLDDGKVAAAANALRAARGLRPLR